MAGLGELFLTFAKVGVMTFGGGYAMLPRLQREIVEHKGWATEEELADCFREFAPFKDECRFRDCAHLCEKGCAVVDAVARGEISASRHESYKIMYEEAKQLKEWELK